jgi:hypothetical protein
VIILCLGLFARPTGCVGASAFELVFPEANTVVNVGTLVVAELSVDFPRDQVDGVSFEFSFDGFNWLKITGVAPDGVAEFAALWNAGFFPAGDYFLRAALTEENGQVTISNTVPVHLNEQPIAVAVASAIQNGLRVHFDASASQDKDGQIVNYEWDFGDGTTGEGSIVEHEYTRRGVYGISITIRDDLQGESTAHYVLAIARPGSIKFKEKENCGCRTMKIKDNGDVVGPLNFGPETRTGIPPAEQGKLGAYHGPTVVGQPDQLDMTKNEFAVKTRFEVIAGLHDLSKPQLCAEGQRTQRTRSGVAKRGAISSDPRYNSGTEDQGGGPDDPYNQNDDRNIVEVEQCPYGHATNWCDDEYHRGGGADGTGKDNEQPPHSDKRYENQKRILWIDSPGLTKLSKAEVMAIGVLRRAKFEATISGNLGRCKCSWEVLIEIDTNGRVLKNEVLNISDGCTAVS